jgi:carboxyl-terminal processing protease
MHDGSMIRLTIARYYSPSGRCIQKPYTAGGDKNYDEDILERYQHGEFFSQDSIKHDGPEYHTSNGRVVYGGGGITPDIFIAEDTLNMTSYYKEASMSGLILQFAYEYTDENRPTLSKFKDLRELEAYLKRINSVEVFANYAEKNGLKRRNLMIQKSHRLLERYINSRLVYSVLDEQSWTMYLNREDPAIRETLRLFRDGQAFPQKQEKDK